MLLLQEPKWNKSYSVTLNCRKDVKCQEIKQLEYGGRQKNNKLTQ